MVCTKEVSFSINMKVEGVPLSHAVAQDCASMLSGNQRS